MIIAWFLLVSFFVVSGALTSLSISCVHNRRDMAGYRPSVGAVRGVCLGENISRCSRLAPARWSTQVLPTAWQPRCCSCFRRVYLFLRYKSKRHVHARLVRIAYCALYTYVGSRIPYSNRFFLLLTHSLSGFSIFPHPHAVPSSTGRWCSSRWRYSKCGRSFGLGGVSAGSGGKTLRSRSSRTLRALCTVDFASPAYLMPFLWAYGWTAFGILHYWFFQIPGLCDIDSPNEDISGLLMRQGLPIRESKSDLGSPHREARQHDAQQSRVRARIEVN